ncbi:hypothetical protein BTH42_10320 [Burkholderia sp. SRS-W-2-2016]|uniref:hypothetical protein n=1 Tax=Burkholderia sp. SRS-W-2-2016 TaxID=1926878 RepID=UPI00094AF879|nr:hypothetical protein [Burkholderia sp. SRS-W-2-2016]OLL31701.1 hypothetical protein BTH42_10320 [Burkholderia sp. SRS-W-2-2016]
MSYPSRVTTVLTSCVLTATAAAGFQCCIAATANADFDSGLDDSAVVLRTSGNTPFPRFDSARIPFSQQPAVDDSIALCMPDLYCSLAAR